MASPAKNIITAINHSLDLEIKESISMDELKTTLTSWVHQLINTNFNKLVHILYRIDVSEIKLKQLLRENPEEDAGEIIATLIIDRQCQKIKSRKENPPNTNLSGEDKW